MKRDNWFASRFEMINAVLIAVVSLTTAFAVWRTNAVGSNAADESRQALIDTVKKQAFDNENFRKVYEEAGFAYQFAVKQAETQALESSADSAAQERAANLKQYLLPNLQLFAGPLATDEQYQREDGTYDLEKRLADMQTPEESQLDPSATFARADMLFSQQRWLVIGSVLLALSLFGLTLAEIGRERLRSLGFGLGLGMYVLGILWLVGVELVFFFSRGG